ncbi:DUF6161 domain-containing protein [Treponema endosymbiont of Eucomonympha sp.]|uniref:DUF6161 domain-containing protein n=1 Tax=Treponema endosymbiont of Eucomonympha sp. TaxID=1580831 RepID=UPI000750DD91|nr:DUF6161 domain-containing protein [Treponema endosymbiont of Eucomonympha sp.]
MANIQQIQQLNIPAKVEEFNKLFQALSTDEAGGIFLSECGALKPVMDFIAHIFQEDNYAFLPLRPCQGIQPHIKEINNCLSIYQRTNDRGYFGHVNTALTEILMQLPYLSFSAKALNAETLKPSIDSIIQNTQSYENFLTGKKKELSDDITAFKQGTEAWKQEKQHDYDQLVTAKQEKLTELENLYEEKLRIQGPAKYWEEFRDSYRKIGTKWIISAVVTGVIIAGIAIFLLTTLPEQLFIGDKVSIENTIRWTVVFALVFSTLFYLFRMFMKLALSAFHLSRDANERFQLTHQYLSLLQEKVIDEKSRDIILQSLFSRADTGLLKGDSSPTMPDGVVGQVFANLGKS